jgi:HSP20 family molecular chaperone IbpA
MSNDKLKTEKKVLTNIHRNPFSNFNTDYSFRMSDFFNEEIKDYRVEKKNDHLLLSVDLPGVKLSDISITAEDRFVTIEYSLRNKMLKKEFSIHKMYDISTAKAKHHNGVLDIEIFTSEQKQKRTIDIVAVA